MQSIIYLEFLDINGWFKFYLACKIELLCTQNLTTFLDFKLKYLYQCKIIMLNKITPGVKSEANLSEAPVSSYSNIRLKSVISSGGQGPSCLASRKVRSFIYQRSAHNVMISLIS